jgi:hypothetical protein
MNYITGYWSRSVTYRVLLSLAIIYAVLRLAFQVFLFTDALDPAAMADGTRASATLQRSYITAARHFQAREDLYLKDSLQHIETHYLYSPAFALFISPILLLPLQSLLPLMVIIHVAAYTLLYIWWNQIFEQSNLFPIARQWARLLPLYLVFSAFWDSLAYMNMFIIIALFVTFLIYALLQEKLDWAAFWLGAVLLQFEPYWALVLILPLVLRRYRFFFKLLAGTALAYLIVAGITVAAGGFDYGIRQYQDYFSFLAHLTRDYPWWGPDKPFLGYNHSIMQSVLYFLGVSAANMRLATIIKLILLLPLGWISLKFLRHPGKEAANAAPGTTLALIFALYLGAFIWSDMVWELSLGVAIFAYLLATLGKKQNPILLWLLFGLYALLDIWRSISYMTLRGNVPYLVSYVPADPLVYVPWIMMVILVFYAMLLLHLNKLSTKLP